MPFDAAIKQTAIPHPWAFRKGLAASPYGSLRSTSTSQSSISSTAASTAFPAIIWEQGKPRRLRAAMLFKSSEKVAAYFQEELARELCIASCERGAGASKRDTP